MDSIQKQFDFANGNYILNATGPNKSIQILWEINLKCESAPFLYDDILYICENQRFHALYAQTGQNIWHYDTPGRTTIPVFYDKLLIVGGNYIDNYVYALNKDTGEEIWEYYTGTYAASVQTPPVIHNNFIYALAGKSIHCLSLTGKKQWRFNLKKKTGLINLIVDSNNIYAVTDEGYDKQELYSIDITKRELSWKIKTPDLASNLLKINYYLFYLNRKAELCQVNTLTQDVTVSKILEKENRARNLYLSYHNGIMVIVIDYYIFGLNITTSSWSWQWHFHSSAAIGRPVITEDSIYFATSGNGVISLDLYTGKPLFHKKSDTRSTYSCGIGGSKIFVAGSMNEYVLTAYGEK